MSEKPKALKPVLLYDHLPGILAGYPAILFALLAALSLVRKSIMSGETKGRFVAMCEELGFTEDQIQQLASATQPLFNINQHMLFWIGLSAMLVWYVAFRFNMPKNKFLLMFGLIGTFVGIPVVLELTGRIRPFSYTSDLLAGLEPTVNTGAWIIMSLVFFVIWAGNFIYSRTHMKVRIDESGLTITRLGGKAERYELIGLKTETEPLDYLELFLAGVGSLSLKTRMNKPIFTMKRIIGLYRTPWFPFFPGKLARINQILSYQGKVVSVDRQDQLDAAEMSDASDDHDDDGDEIGDGFDAPSAPSDSRDERGFD